MKRSIALRITSGNYLEKVDGATFIKFGTGMYIYFYQNQIVGVQIGDDVYVAADGPTTNHLGINTKRVRDWLVNRRRGEKTTRIPAKELREKAEDLIMLTANRLINNRLADE